MLFVYDICAYAIPQLDASPVVQECVASHIFAALDVAPSRAHGRVWPALASLKIGRVSEESELESRIAEVQVLAKRKNARASGREERVYLHGERR